MKNLTRLRQHLNLTVPQLAVYAGVSPSTLLNAERNPGSTRSITLAKLAMYLSKQLGVPISIEHLLDMKAIPNNLVTEGEADAG